MHPFAYSLNAPSNPEYIFEIPAGPHQSVDLDVWAKSSHWYYGATASIAVRPAGTTVWKGIDILTVAGTDSKPAGVSASRRITLGWANAPQTPLQIKLSCSGYKGGQCTFSHLRFWQDSAGWQLKDVSNSYTLTMPSMAVYAATYAQPYYGIAPANGSFLGIDTTQSGGGAAVWKPFAVRSSLLHLPSISSTAQMTVSVNWARAITGPLNGSSASGLDVAFVTAESTPQTINLLTLPGGTTGTPWSRSISAFLPTTLSGRLGRLQFSGVLGSVPRLFALDSITFYRNGKAVAIPADQVVGQCDCNQGGRINDIVRDPVNTFSGAFLLSTSDRAIPSGGPAFTFGRTYTSMFADTAAFPTTALGPGWRHSFAAALTLPGTTGGEAQTVIYEAPTGNRLRFYDDGVANTMLDPAPGIHATLVRASTTYTLTMRNQSIQRFDSQGRLIEQRDPQGHRQTLSYYSAPGSAWDGQLQQVTDIVSGRSLILTYTAVNGQPRLVAVTDPLNQAVQYAYTANGDLETVTDLRSGVTTYRYTGAPHLVTSVEDAAGTVQVANTYDSQRRITQQVEPTGAVVTYSSTQTSAGQVTTMTTQPPGAAPADVLIDHYRLDGSLAYQEHNGQFVGYATFDDSLTPSVSVDGSGQATLLSNTAEGLPLQLTDATGQTQALSYDATNHPTQVTGSSGITTTVDYDGAANPTALKYAGANGVQQTSSYTYTADNRILEQQAPDGVRTRYAYDSLGQVTGRTTGYGTALAQTTTYGYDALGRVITTTSGAGTPLARTDSTTYNADNSLASSTQNYQDGTFDPDHPDQDITTSYGYDLLGRRIWTRNALGQYAVTHYAAQGQVDWTARNFRAAGWSGGALPATPAAYSPAQPDANVATFYGYDGLGRATVLTETGILSGAFNPSTLQFSSATSRVTRTEYDQLSRPVTVTLNYQPGALASADTNVQTVTYYDGTGNPIWQRDALGRWNKTEYDAISRPITTTVNYENGDPRTVDAANQAWTDGSDSDIIQAAHYDARGHADQQIDNWVNGAFTATEPITDRVTLSQFDALGRPTATIQNHAPGLTDTTLNRTTTTAYDSTTGWVIGQQDALGRWIRQQYDLLGRVTISIQNCQGSQAPQICGAATTDQNVASQTRYDALGRAFETVDPLGVVTHTSFDSLGRTTATTRNYVAGGATTPVTNVTTLMVYDALGRVTATTDALNARSTSAYNGLGQTVVVTDTMGRVTTMGYDGQSTLRWMRRADGQVTVYQADGLGRTIASIVNFQNGVVETTDTADQDLVTETVYDAAGRRIESRVRTTPTTTQTTHLAYDHQDRLIAVTENATTGTCVQAPCDVVTQYQYDRASNRTAIIDANGHARHFAYDAADQTTESIDALGHTTGWAYDAGGRVTTQRDPRSTAFDLTYTFDGLDRVIGTTAGDPSQLSPISAQYDVLGRRTALSDGTGTTSFQYDRLGRVTRVQAPQTGIVGYGYNPRGQRTQLTYPDGTALQYGYWPDGQLQVVTGTTTLANYSYDAVGRLQSVARANGATTSYSYDGVDRVRNLHTEAGIETLSDFTYQLNRLGQRTVVTETLALTPPPTSTPTSTPTNTPTNTPTPTPTTTPTNTPTNTPTTTPEPPTATPTPATPTPAPAYGGQTHMRQVIYAGSSFWYRDSTNPEASSWPTSWNTQTYASAWGSSANPPPTSAVSAVTMRAFYDADMVRISMRQAIYAGSSFWYRDSSDADGTSWPNSWLSVTYATSWGSDGNPPPTTAVDSVVIRPLYDGQGRQLNMRQAIYVGSTVWYRDSTDRGGTQWPTTWTTMAYATAWSGSAGTAPPISAISEVIFRPVYDPSTGALTNVRQTVYAGNTYYTRDSTDPTASAWGAWASGTYASSWGSTTNPPPTTAIDAFMIRAFYPSGETFAFGAPQSGDESMLATPPQTLSSQSMLLQTRVITYAYDGLQRLVGANESPGSAFAYAYDLAGNRTDVWTNGGLTTHQDYNAANQVSGWSYDNAGNLISDGTATSAYDALGRMTGRGSTTYSYNGDGVLVDDGTTRYTQDLASPLSQILQTTQGSAITNYLYGLDRLASVAGSNRTWYGTDALGSVRQTLDDAGMPLGVVNYDPWGTPESGSVPTFGFTGELQDTTTGLVNLRARWYSTSSGTFPAHRWRTNESSDTIPYSHHPYAYALSDPVQHTDHSGKFIDCTIAPNQSMPLNCRFWTWEEWTQTGAQVQKDVAQSPKTRLVSGLADISLIGDAKGIIEGATGQDLLTGKPLPWWQRGLSLLCLSELRGIGRLGVVADALEASSASGAALRLLKAVSGDPADEAIQLAQQVKPLPGFYDAIAHGKSTAIQLLINGEVRLVPAQEAAEWIRSQPDYTLGTPVRLLCCNAGRILPNGPNIAQQIAQELGTNIVAADSYIGPNIDGTMTLYKLIDGDYIVNVEGKWRLFDSDGGVHELVP